MPPPTADSVDDVVDRVYEELHRLASSYMRRERAGHTLQPTALVSEAYLKLSKDPKLADADPNRFLAIAARCMRQILVDHARRRGRAKRGGGWGRVTLSDAEVDGDGAIDVIAFDEALAALAASDERKARIVELRTFAGMTLAEVAQSLGLSTTTVEDDWYLARAWLRRRLHA